MRDVGKELDLVYAGHFWPHDGKQKEQISGKERYKTARDMGLQVTVLKKEKDVVQGIERTRKMLPYATFNESRCGTLVDALEHYQRQRNKTTSTEEKPVYMEHPLHDWSSHPADSERYVSMAVKKMGSGHTQTRTDTEIDKYKRMYAGVASDA